MKSIHITTVLIAYVCVILSCSKDPADPTNPVTDESGNYTVSTFVGNGLNGTDPQTGGLALLYMPCNIVFDAQGNLYIADSQNDRVRKVNSTGTMTNFAGSTIGYLDGTGTAAQFNRPTIMTIDAQGNLYVGEGSGLRFRKITAAGVVTTVAGNGTAGLVDGTGTAAQIDIPAGLVVDAQGNIYFTQQNFHGIRKITAAGVVSTFVGGTTAGFAEGVGTSAKFKEPFNMFIDAQNNIYVVDNGNARIRKVTPAGEVSTVLQRDNANLLRVSIRDAQGNFYITEGDMTFTNITKYSTAGTFTKLAGGVQGYEDGSGTVAKFGPISGMAMDGAGNLFVTDLLNGAVRKIRRN